MSARDDSQHIDRSRREALRAAALWTVTAAAGSAVATSANATEYPSKPITLVHSFPAGSFTDNAGRLVAERLSQRLGQSVVVYNRPGASGLIGTEFVAKAEPDGYTMLMVYTDLFSINPVLFKKVGYEPLKDFDPLTLIGSVPMALSGSTTLEPKTMTDLLAAARTRKTPFTLGTWGVGSLPHMLGEVLCKEAGIELTYVPFQGGAPSVTAVMSGHVDLTFTSGPLTVDLARAGKVRPYAMGGQKRLPAIPDIPTFRELSLSNVNAAVWHGLVVRAGGRKEIIDRLYAELAAVLKEPETQAKLLVIGYEAVDGRDPAQFRRFIAEDAARWGPIVKASGAQVER